MKKNLIEDGTMVKDSRNLENSRFSEKIWYVMLCEVRSHARSLYLPLDPLIVTLHRIKDNDILNVTLLEARFGVAGGGGRKRRIWLSLPIKVSRHSRVLILRLESSIAKQYGLRVGDVVKLELRSILRGPSGDLSQSEREQPGEL